MQAGPGPERCPELPFLFVSGAIGMNSPNKPEGRATDVCSKTGWPDSCRRSAALWERPGRARRAQVDNNCAKARNTMLVNSVDGIVWQTDLADLRFTFVSQQAERMLVTRSRGGSKSYVNKAIFIPKIAKTVACANLTTEEQHQSEYHAGGRWGVWLHIVSVRLVGTHATTLGHQSEHVLANRLKPPGGCALQTQGTNKILMRRNNEIQKFTCSIPRAENSFDLGKEFISIVMDGLAGPLNQLQLEYHRRAGQLDQLCVH